MRVSQADLLHPAPVASRDVEPARLVRGQVADTSRQVDRCPEALGRACRSDPAAQVPVHREEEIAPEIHLQDIRLPVRGPRRRQADPVKNLAIGIQDPDSPRAGFEQV